MAVVKALVVAGGGSGANGNGSGGAGGGGAGGFLYDASHSVTAQAYSITVGNGGARMNSGGVGNKGQDSVFDTMTAKGGGAGIFGDNTGNPANGGSGGGGINGVSGTGTGGQGNNGGVGNVGADSTGGGGGGSSQVGGGNVSGSGTGGKGGDGTANSISGASVTYAGGGGGCSAGGSASTGGTGGGGHGNASSSGTDATGFGSGGGGGYTTAGGAGSIGVVIISYAADGSDGPTSLSTGGTITTVGGQRIHTFTASGTLTISTTVGMSVSDTSAITESVTLSVIPFPDKPSVSDTTAVTDSPTIKFFDSPDESSSLVVSDYKWLTSTLKTAQQSYAVRPYFKCVILDDTVQPNQIINNVATQQPLIAGSAVTAPDGSILAVGFDNSNHISFFKAANLHTSNGVWDTTTILDSSGTSILGGKNQKVIISCSEYISGSYHIDVYYFNNFGNDGSNLNVIQKYSDDGGTTWSTRTIALSGMPNTSYLSTSVDTLSLAALKPRLVSGTLNSGFLFTKPTGITMNSGFVNYDIMYTVWTGASFSSQLKWNAKNVNSGDWTVHSIDSFYLNGVDYIVFSGFKNFVDTANDVATFPALAVSGNAAGNYAIWITSFVAMTETSAGDIMAKPVKIISSDSINATNLNSFLFPVATVTNGTVNITFRAVTVSTVSPSAQGSTSQIVTTVTNYMLTKTVDGVNFTYPSIIVSSGGTQFNDDSQGLGDNRGNSYTNQGVYYYLLGSGKLWEFVQNNVLADVSNDVIQYSINDSAGQPSSISLQIANQNNMWYPSGTNSGASAVSKNKKILLQQGFYNANGVAEVTSRNIYYIDDIVQATDSRSNNVTISGRDFYKKFKTTVTKYSYGFVGPYLYSDIFDGSTIGNWSQISGTWTESSNTLVSTSTSSDSIAVLTGVPSLSYGSFMAVTIIRNLTGTQYVYGFFIDTSNWLRLEITDGSWAVKKCIAGVTTTLDSDTTGLSSNISYPVYVRRYDYFKFNFMLGTGGATVGNPLVSTTTVYLYGHTSSPVGEYDLTSDLIVLAPQPLPVALGANTLIANFQFFKYSQFDNSSSISDLIQSLATKAGVNSFDIQNILSDNFVDTSSYSGTFTDPNNTIVITAGNSILNTVTANKIANGEISFQAKLTPTNSGSQYGFRVLFRSDNAGNSYYWHILIASTGGYQSSQFERLYSGTTYIFPAQMSNVTNNLPGTLSGGNHFDLTKTHTYKLVMVDGWMFAFIDGVMVNAWNDNNTTSAFLTTGFWGWSADSNTQITLYNMASTAFWKQVNQFSLNPGDDIENALVSLVQSVRAWIFSNLMGTLKAIFLNSTDATTYTYQNQIYAQGVDSSDKEFVSQVTVYGDNVSAVARDTTLMAGRSVREEVVVDYTIKTQQDALTRATYELVNSNQYQSQYNPKQTMNVGAELFDAVTVVDTGNNTTGINGTSRVYAQKLTTGGNGGGNEYSIEIDTGNL